MNLKSSLLHESPYFFTFVTIIFLILLVVSRNKKILFYLICTIYILLILLLIWFYRIPDSKNFISNSNIIIAPCDGVVKSVYYNNISRCYKIVIYLNILDQHHQFYPVAGVVEDSVYTPGSFHPAYILDKSQYNERHLTTIRTKFGDTVRVTQIAGQVARRIVNNSIPGKLINQGERIGMIKLSSRVDIEFSKNHYIPVVKPGDRVYALKTLIANRL